MRNKRFFALALVLCLVLSTLAPMASAEEVGAGTYTIPQNTENATSLPFTQIDDLDIDLPEAELPDSIAELKELSKQYAADEIVDAFVVMEGQPLAETYSSPLQVTAAVEKKLLDKQDDAISAIEEDVLGGEKLEVRYQFTYLTNAFSISTEFANLEKIAAMDGVKSVFVMPVYELCSTFNPNTAGGAIMTGVPSVWEDLEYTGAGMKIAIIDTGLDLDHPSFAAAPEDPAMEIADIQAVLGKLNAYKANKNATAENLYRSAKVPFAFNYADLNLTADHSSDDQGDHGTHVAGIAAANALEGTTVKGMAPDAQIIVMKVFGASRGAGTDVVVAALEDAMTLGCDVVNASLGSPCGFTSSGSAEIDAIYERLAKQDIIATFSAGNEGNNADYNMWDLQLEVPFTPSRNPDNGAVGSPSTWANTLSIASADNSTVMTTAFELADGTVVFYQDSYEVLIGDRRGIPMETLAGKELGYVVIQGGEAADFEGKNVAGKIAFVEPGSGIFFTDIMANAEAAGAAGIVLVMWEHRDNLFNFGFSIIAEDGSYIGIPFAHVAMEDGPKLIEAEEKTLTVAAGGLPRAVVGGQMSEFSSWGVTNDLKIGPDITGIGGNVYSTLDGGNYGVMSGTSMSAPQLAGISALVLQHLKELYPDAESGELRAMAEAMMMSTAEPIIADPDYYIEASPRQQGAGLVNAYKAVTTQTYLTVDGGRPKAELGDSVNGTYEFSFEVHNFGHEEVTYNLYASLMTEAVASAYGEIFMLGMNDFLYSEVTFDQETVTVPAGQTVTVNASIALNEDDKEFFELAYPNGGYVEGFVYLFNDEGILSLPFLGFYGEWSEAPVFDTAYWYDNSFWNGAPMPDVPEGDQSYHIFWTSMAGKDNVLGMNPYGVLLGDDDKIMYDPAHNVVSPNGDRYLDAIDEIYLSLLRNAKYLDFTYTIDGEVVENYNFLNNAKTMFLTSYQDVVPLIHSWYGMAPYNFTDANGKVLPSGTEVLLTIDAYIDDGDLEIDDTFQIPITVDTEAPEILQVAADKDGDADLMYVFVSDDVAMAGVFLLDASGNELDMLYDVELIPYGNGISVAVFDVTDLGSNFIVYVGDYGCNEAGYRIPYTPVPRVQFIGNSLSLAGDIGLNFYYDLPDWILADEGSYIVFTDENGTEIEKIYFTEEEDPFINADGYYRYSVQFAAKEMGDEVTAQIFSSDGEECDPVTMNIQGYVKKAFAKSNDENLIALMKAMLNYGSAAQVEFQYDTENPANSILDEADRAVPTADASEYAQVVTGTDAGLTFVGASLILDSETSIRIYFDLAEGKSPEDFTFTVDGETVEAKLPNAADHYYITLTDIAAKDLDQWHTFCIGDITVEYAALSYVARVQAVASGDADLMNLVNSIYAYSETAESFFNAG